MAKLFLGTLLATSGLLNERRSQDTLLSAHNCIRLSRILSWKNSQIKQSVKLTRITISRLTAAMALLEDLNWPFKLLRVTLLIIFLDRKVLLWRMDIIQRQLKKTIWISHFPTTQTVCRNKIECNLKFISEIILSYKLDIGSSGTDFSLADSVSIRFVKIYLNIMNFEKFQFLIMPQQCCILRLCQTSTRNSHGNMVF